MKKNIYVVIMAGGSGTRFWPYSRNRKPKQFLDVLGVGRSLLQMTFDRFKEYTSNDKIWVVSNDIYDEVIQEQLPELGKDQILLEPMKRNTAPCIAYAAYKIKQQDPDAVLVITPSDHAIFKPDAFLSVIHSAVEHAAESDKLITIGIQPHKPETGYGYIQYLESDHPVKPVKTFTEKPELEMAKTFLSSGDFVWNSGIFVWSISSIISAFEQYQPDMAALFNEGKDSYFTENEKPFIDKTYSLSKGISIDYAIMEKASNVFVVLGDFGWSDLGSWDALHELKDKDENDNVIEHQAILYNSRNNYIKARKDKLVVIADLEGYLVSDFDDVLLICKKDDSAKFKTFVSEVKATKGDKFI
ncbi:MAG: mannose-1-phosphate guanylyltransferase [Cyclobacteriaceae bacterium]